MIRRWSLVRVVVVVAAMVLGACSESRSSAVSPPATSLPAPSALPTAAPTTTTPPPALQRFGEPFLLGDLRLTVLSVQDPFPSNPQVGPAPGNRLVSIKYEMVSQSTVTRNVSDLPAVELRDSSGAGYQSEHGRLSVVGGSPTPGELPAGKRMETSALFEVPGSATGLQVWFGTPTAPGGRAAVPLD